MMLGIHGKNEISGGFCLINTSDVEGTGHIIIPIKVKKSIGQKKNIRRVRFCKFCGNLV